MTDKAWTKLFWEWSDNEEWNDFQFMRSSMLVQDSLEAYLTARWPEFVAWVLSRNLRGEHLGENP
jgi:hypothetical protein